MRRYTRSRFILYYLLNSKNALSFNPYGRLLALFSYF
jgi:hypothetical protein